MIMRKWGLHLQAMSMAVLLVWLDGCGNIGNRNGISTPLCVTSREASLDTAASVGERLDATGWMLTDFRHVDAYQRYRQIFDSPGSVAALRHAGTVSAQRGHEGAASLSCHRDATPGEAGGQR